MSVLFTPRKLGNLEIKNRFVHSGTSECMATKDGEVTDALVRRYQILAKNDVGLIVTGYMSVHANGRARHHQTGLHADRFLPGLEKMAQAIHDEGGLVLFQLVHAGRQTKPDVIGRTPLGPSAIRRDPTYLVKPKTMSAVDIKEVITAYAESARRAVKAGADGIHVSAAGGYLINQFLSPFLNQRTDEWGGSCENRFRLLKEIVSGVKEVLPDGMPLVVKISTDDHTPKPGVVLAEAQQHAAWLADLGVDGLEIASGNLLYCHMTMWHGDVPTKELVQSLPLWQKPVGWLLMKLMEGRYDLQGPWNLPAAKAIRSVVGGDLPLFLVGGLRKRDEMEHVVNHEQVDFIQMCRPFIREPSLVRKFKEEKITEVACISCNRCLGGIANNLPIACYYKGLPPK